MSRGLFYRCFAAGMLLLHTLPASSQRVYAGHSVLATGAWYKIAVTGPGIYKIDIPFLNTLGINTSSLSSSSIRIFGNGGLMLPENPSGLKKDDLFENAIRVEDGGDGILNGPDYLLFYATGPNTWLKDSINKSFLHQKNLYSDTSYYYITVGGTGKRIVNINPSISPTTTVSTYDFRYYYELDTVNFLSSGRQWYGEDYTDAPGKTLTRQYAVTVPAINGASATLKTNLLSRSFGNPGRFAIQVNSQPVQQINISPVATGPYDLFAREVQSSVQFTSSQPSITIRFDYTPGSFNAQGWLDWFEVLARCELTMNGLNQLLFRDWNSVAIGNVGNFIIKNANPQTQVWDITNPLEPLRLQANLTGTDLQFVNDCSSLHEYIAFNNSNYLLPVAKGKVDNQDLHNSSVTDFLIITHPTLKAQAQQLAQFHLQHDTINSTIVTTEQVYNEFSSGSPDPVALRDFVKMYYDKAAGDTTLQPNYLLLLGDASFDYKARITNNTNLVPAYESPVSLDPLSTYTSDDFFGFLDDGDDINGNGTYLLDIGIGRIPARNTGEAQAYVDKLLAYTSSESLGPWRNELTFVADDEDNNLHLQDAEIITNAVLGVTPLVNIDKIYLDAFQQQSASGGSRYPGVNLAINNKLFNGTLIWNYTGHGGFRRLAEEVVLDQDIINTFNNPNKLPLFITATCDFAPFDNPLISSIGENLLLRPKTGAIGLMTTTRLVFAFSNRVMNENYLRIALQKKPDSTYLSLGEAVRRAKNYTYTFFGDVNNNRKFTLLGDPALTLGFPRYQVKTTAVNGAAVTTTPDTLKALTEYTIEGLITDNQGTFISGYNGTLYATVFDKDQAVTTLANDPGSLLTTFREQKNRLFKGKAEVANGQFTFRFVVPKDIEYQFGKGKISYYTDNGQLDGNGAFTNIIVGGSGNNSIADKEGPDIKAYLNDEKFVNGSISNNRPVLLVKLADSSGINIMGTGIGHDLVAILDNDQEQSFILNEFYESETGSYQKGIVRFQLPVLAEGLHSLTVKAWDVANNSNEASIDFRVIRQETIALDHVLNYPNPFTTRTSFWFDHNRPGEELAILIQVYTVSGKLVKTLRKTIFSTGNRSSEVEWDGRDDYGKKIGRGVYIYRLRVRASDGKAAEKFEKLYIL